MIGLVDKGTAKGAGICGIILLICGIASMISGFIWIGVHGYGGYGLWSGIGLTVAGILGIVAGVKRNKGVLVGFLVLTIIMIIVATIQAIISGLLYTVFKVLADPGQCYISGNRCVCPQNSVTYDASFCDAWTNLVNSLLAITIFSVVGAIVSLVGSIFGCIGSCSSTQQQPGTVMMQQPVAIVTTTTHQGYAQNPGYPQQQQGYAVQQPGQYVQQQPGYPAQHPQQHAAAFPPPQYTEKQ